MVQQKFIQSTRHNGKEGQVNIEFVDITTTQGSTAAQERTDSILLNLKIISENNPSLLDSAQNQFLNDFHRLAKDCKADVFLGDMTQKVSYKGLNLSIDTYYWVLASEERNPIFSQLQYSFRLLISEYAMLEPNTDIKVLKVIHNFFWAGFGLCFAMTESQCAAGQARTEPATQYKVETAKKKKQEAIKMAQDLRIKKTNISINSMASQIAPKIERSEKTTKKYLYESGFFRGK